MIYKENEKCTVENKSINLHSQDHKLFDRNILNIRL